MHEASEASKTKVVSVSGDVRDQCSVSGRGIAYFHLRFRIGVRLEEDSEHRSEGWLSFGPAPADVIT